MDIARGIEVYDGGGVFLRDGGEIGTLTRCVCDREVIIVLCCLRRGTGGLLEPLVILEYKACR